MTPQQQLAFIKSKCIEAVPSILDLKFGCEVKKGYRMFQNSTGYVCGVDRSDIYVRYGVPSVEEDTALFQRWDIKPEEIIGRPIQLSDVLLAIKEIIPKMKPYGFKTYKDDMIHVMLNWNLLLPLDGQSEQVWTFLYELLSK